jgi:hypothetical protein
VRWQRRNEDGIKEKSNHQEEKWNKKKIVNLETF